MQKGSNIRQVFERLAHASEVMEKKMKFTHDDHLGFVSTCPTNLGTGMRASVHIKLPKLMHDKEKLDYIAEKYHVQVRGSAGEHQDTNDGVFDISNSRRLGHSETALLQDMYDGVKAFIKEEKKL